MISLQFNNIISERDMDLLFAEAIVTDVDFCRLLIDKTDLAGKPFQVLGAELSKVDSKLGESDITVIIDVEGTKYGLLIENKIGAIAMPEQHSRYIKRGEKGVKKSEYNDFRVFIICPKKYYENNDDAKLYEHMLTYEECKGYFEQKDEPTSVFRRLQLEQVLDRAKKPPIINVDEKANVFLRQYISYQKTNYPSLDRSTKEDKNGWWVDYRTELGYVIIVHKIQEGYVDLMFPKASDKIERVKMIADWAGQHKIPVTAVVKAKKSAMVRLQVPKLNIIKGFEFVDKEELNQCFDIIKELTDFANIIEMANSIVSR